MSKKVAKRRDLSGGFGVGEFFKKMNKRKPDDGAENIENRVNKGYSPTVYFHCVQGVFEKQNFEQIKNREQSNRSSYIEIKVNTGCNFSCFARSH